MGDIGEGIDQPVVIYPEVIDELAQNHPDDLWVKIPQSNDLTSGWRDVTFKELAHAVNGLARWIEEKLGVGNGRKEDAVAYIGLNDLRYMVVQFALTKAGYSLMLLSPRNSLEGQQWLMHATNTKAFLCSEGVDMHISGIQKASPKLPFHQIPSFDDVLERGVREGAYKGHYNAAPDYPAVILHSSGSTGLPKPIYVTNDVVTHLASINTVPAPPGRRVAMTEAYRTGDLMFNMSPMFHAMGTYSVVARTVLHRAPVVMLPTDRPPNAAMCVKVIEQTRPTAALFAPALLEQVAEYPGGMEALARLRIIMFGGAPMAPEIGNRISNVTVLASAMGSTEATVVHALINEDKRDWPYFEWALESGVDMQPEMDGLFEMVLVRNGDRTFKGIFYTFPDLTEYRTKDLYEPHPTKPNLWRYAGRKDDVLVLSNGEKTNPVDFEKAVEGHPLVHGALVVGAGRFQAGLLIEPAWTEVPDHCTPEELLDLYWPNIEQANVIAPAHGQIWKSKVAIAKRDKPFVRAGKGSIIRRMTTDLYAAEIDALYSNESSDESIDKLEPGSSLTVAKQFLRDTFKSKGLAIPGDVADDADLFSFGVDSLQVLAISSTLSHALRSGKQRIVSPRVIYSHPTIEALAKCLQELVNGDVIETKQISHHDAMKRMVEKYTQDLTVPTLAATPSPRLAKHSVILTGSTGSLGNYILEELLALPYVDQIFCLNRSADAESQQRSSFQSRGATTDFAKVTFFHTDFGKEHFGLSDENYTQLLDSVDIFMHNAWTVDFNMSLESYEPVHIAGTRRCVDFSLQSKHRAHIVFVSSIASVSNWSAPQPLPETPLEDYSLPLPQGYGESKHVASQILAIAAKQAGVSSTTIRSGQLAGPSKEGIEWNRHEWLPSLVISSKAMGMLPETLGNQDQIDWVPVDLAGRTVVETALSHVEMVGGREDLASVTHLVNPQTASWKDLVPVMQELLGCEVVPFEKWLEVLKQAPQTAEVVEKTPAIKLIDFYEGLLQGSGRQVRLSTVESVKISETLSDMQPISGEMMETWIKRWMQ